LTALIAELAMMAERAHEQLRHPGSTAECVQLYFMWNDITKSEYYLESDD
jgi:hypothetical protein